MINIWPHLKFFPPPSSRLRWVGYGGYGPGGAVPITTKKWAEMAG